MRNHRLGLQSVDHALRLLDLLREGTSLGPQQAADHLGVARSTGHRLLASLEYRGYAEAAGGRYTLGPAIRDDVTTRSTTLSLRRAAAVHMRRVVDTVNESVHLQTLVGTDVLILETVECSQELRVGSRAGKRLPAQQAAGGQAMLASLSAQDLEALYSAAGDEDGTSGCTMEPTMLRTLATVRRNGYARNVQTHRGFMSLGVSIPTSDNDPSPLGALVLAFPTFRYRKSQTSAYVTLLAETARHISLDVASM